MIKWLIIIVSLYMSISERSKAHEIELSADTYTQQIVCLAANIYNEARGGDIDSMVSVAQVTMNRVNSPMFPNNICDVVYQEKQFSWTAQAFDTENCFASKESFKEFAEASNKLRPVCGHQALALSELYPNQYDFESWGYAMDIALGVAESNIESEVGSALFYHRVDISTSWSAKLVEVGQVGEHRFFKLGVSND